MLYLGDSLDSKKCDWYLGGKVLRSWNMKTSPGLLVQRKLQRECHSGMAATQLELHIKDSDERILLFFSGTLEDDLISLFNTARPFRRWVSELIYSIGSGAYAIVIKMAFNISCHDTKEGYGV